MERKDFEKWHPLDNLAKMHYLENIAYDDGLKITFSEAKGYTDTNTCKSFVVHFEQYASYFELTETYADGFWVDSPEKAWTFYKSKKSSYIDYLNTNAMFADTVVNPIHYVFVTVESVFHVISTAEPIFLL